MIETQYFDAREHQPPPDEDFGNSRLCPICQGPYKHGLCVMAERAENGLREMREIREVRERTAKKTGKALVVASRPVFTGHKG